MMMVMMVMMMMMMMMMMMIPNESFSPESGGRVKARMAIEAIRMQGIIRLKKLGKGSFFLLFLLYNKIKGTLSMRDNIKI